MYTQQPQFVSSHSDRDLVLPSPLNKDDYASLEEDYAQYSSPAATRIEKARTLRTSPIDKPTKKTPGRKSKQEQQARDMSDAEWKAFQNRKNQEKFRMKQKLRIEMMEEELKKSEETIEFYFKKFEQLDHTMDRMHRYNQELNMAVNKLSERLSFFESQYYHSNFNTRV